MKDFAPPIFKTSIIFLLLFLSCERPEEFGSVEGAITNEYGDIISRAFIKIGSQGEGTTPSGNYRFYSIPVGSVSIEVSSEHYLTQVREVIIEPNRTLIEDFELLVGTPYLELSDSVLSLSSGQKTYDFRIRSNSPWSIECQDSWTEFSQYDGVGDLDLAFTCFKNTGEEYRETIVNITSGEIQKTLKILQRSELRMVGYETVLSNQMEGREDSVFLRFNKPVELISFRSDYENCLCDIDKQLIDGGKTLKFSYRCARLGHSYPFTFVVEDIHGQRLAKSVNIGFYSRNIEFEGTCYDFQLINDDKEILLALNNPDRILRYSFEDDTINRIYDLEGYIAPRKLTFNPFNNKIYIIGSDLDYRGSSLIDLPDIYTVELETGLIQHSVRISNPDSHPQYPIIFPYDIAFSSSGIGMVLISDDAYSGLTFWLMDYTNNDSLFKHPDDEVYRFSDDFKSIHSSADYSKIFMLPEWNSIHYRIFDRASFKIDTLYPKKQTAGGSHFVVPNRKYNRFYIGQIYSQYIMDVGGNMGSLTEIDVRGGNTFMDFCYYGDEEDLVYCSNNGTFTLIDYKNNEIRMLSDIFYSLTELSSTIDGKYVFAFDNEGIEQKKSMYIFDTEYLNSSMNLSK